MGITIATREVALGNVTQGIVTALVGSAFHEFMGALAVAWHSDAVEIATTEAIDAIGGACVGRSLGKTEALGAVVAKGGVIEVVARKVPLGVGIAEGVGTTVELEGLGAVDRQIIACLVAAGEFNHGLGISRRGLLLKLLHLLNRNGGHKH